MNRRRFAKVGALAALLALTSPAVAQLNVCVDKDGRKTYQQGPCPALQISTGIEPLKVDRITEAGVRKTIELMNRAFTARDTAAFLRFLSAEFRVQSTGGLAGAKTVSLDRAGFAREVSQAHRVMVRYVETSDPASVALGPDHAVYRARVRGTTTLPSGDLYRDADQELTLIIEEGQLVLRSEADTVREEFMRSAAERAPSN